MIWLAGAAFLLSMGLFWGGFKVDKGPGSADERSSAALLYMAGIAAFVLSVILWGIAVTLAALHW